MNQKNSLQRKQLTIMKYIKTFEVKTEYQKMNTTNKTIIDSINDNTINEFILVKDNSKYNKNYRIFEIDKSTVACELFPIDENSNFRNAKETYKKCGYSYPIEKHIDINTTIILQKNEMNGLQLIINELETILQANKYNL